MPHSGHDHGRNSNHNNVKDTDQETTETVPDNEGEHDSNPSGTQPWKEGEERRTTPQPAADGDQSQDQDSTEQELPPEVGTEEGLTEADLAEENLDMDYNDDIFEEEINLEPCEPRDFNSQKFYEVTQCFIDKFGDDSYKDFSSIEKYPMTELKALSTRVNVYMKDFYNYSLFMQNNINKLRSKIRMLSGKIRDFLPRKRENGSGNEVSFEERELLAKIEALKGELAQANVDLSQAVKLSTESESAAIEAALSAQRAKDIARKLQCEMEEQKRLEEEAKVREEERRLAKEEEKKKKEEERRQHELKQQKEIENRLQSKGHLKMASTSVHANHRREMWEDWPLTTFNTESNDYNQGVLCNVRADPTKFDGCGIICESVDHLDTDFVYNSHDELISCIIRVKNANSETEVANERGSESLHDKDMEEQAHVIDQKADDKKEEPGDKEDNKDDEEKDSKDESEVTSNEKMGEIEPPEKPLEVANDAEELREISNKHEKDENKGEDDALNVPVFVAVPHCLSRLSAISREPVIKAKVRGVWKELLTHEVVFDSTKDLKFAQVELTHVTTLAVVSRFKKDYYKFMKKGNKVISSTDSRITLSTEPETFEKTEHIILQVQPVESHSVSELRTKNHVCKGLLASSAILNIDWESEDIDEFHYPIKVTIPCPPNPAKARKAAAIRAMKEARMKNPQKNQQQEEANRKSETSRMDSNYGQPNRWYMGSYGSGDDDENDNLYMFYWNSKSKWQVLPDVNIQQVRLDLLQLDLKEPLKRFVVVRTTTTVSRTEAKAIVHELESYLDKRTVKVMLKQSSENMSDVVIHCVPRGRVDRLMESLREDGYEQGPAPSADLSLHEGDVLKMSFRGNLKSDDSPLQFVFNSHLKSSIKFSVEETDKYLQKSFPMYRGFVQVFGSPQVSTDSVKEARFLCDLLVSIPKNHVLTPSPPIKAPITIKSCDLVNEDLVRHLAGEIGDEWQKLAAALNVKKVRLQAILRNNEHLEKKKREIESRFDMMMTWVKKVPRGVDKVSILRKALRKCERMDLVEELDDLNRDFLKTK